MALNLLKPSDLNSYMSDLSRLLGTDKIDISGIGSYTPPSYQTPVRSSTLNYAQGGMSVAPKQTTQNMTPVPKNFTPAPTTRTSTPAPTPTKTSTPTSSPTRTAAPAASAAYTGGSIVDYLRSSGQASDFNSRARLAQQYGIQGYTGTAAQNTQLLGLLRTKSSTPAPTSTPTQTRTDTGRREKTREELRDEEIADLEESAYGKPRKSTEELYSKAYDAAKLGDLKDQIVSLLETVNKERETAAAAIAEVNENPFLTETSRVGRGKRVLEQLEAKIGNDLTRIGQLQELYNSGVAEVEKLVTYQTTDFGNDQARDQAKLNYLLQQKEKDQTRLDKLADAPTTIGSRDTGVYRWDRDLKQFVQVIAPDPNAGLPNSYVEFDLAQKNPEYKAYLERKEAGDANAFDPTSEQKAVVGRFLSTQEAKTMGASSSDFQAAMNDPEFFYYLLQLANENGIY